jgi:hypothetical protein
MYKFITQQIHFDTEDGHLRHKEIQIHFPYGKDVRYRVNKESTTIYCPQLPVTNIVCEMTTIPEYKIAERLRFRILVCATVTENQHRIPVMGIKNIIPWFQRQGEQHGFQVEVWEKIIPMGSVYAIKEDRKRTHNSVEIQGVLKVVDADLFNVVMGSKKSDCFGIGRAKYSGFGLIEIIE